MAAFRIIERRQLAGCFHIGYTETPEFRVAIAVLSVADSLVGLEQQYARHYPF